MASKWVRPEVSSTPRSGPSARSCHSLFFRSLIYPVSRPRRCTRCSRRRAWPSASAPLASFATSPATQKSGSTRWGGQRECLRTMRRAGATPSTASEPMCRTRPPRSCQESTSSSPAQNEAL
uniref:Uncharacterized protein n=1 Tax=Triticum urartu TaxID=4572 RepID=A0A8R7V2T9_TRIUA